MSNNIPFEKMNFIIKFQRKFRFLKDEIHNVNIKLIFLRDFLMGMINNLSFCNNLKIFQDTDSNYIGILSELKEIKESIDILPDVITFKNININEASLQLLKCEHLIMKYINHISPENINSIFKLFYGDNWKDILDQKIDMETFLFLSR